MKTTAAARERNLRLFRMPRYFTILAAVAVCSLPSSWAFAAEQKTPDPAKPVAAPPPAVIPLADVATKATEASALTVASGASAIPNPQIETIGKSLPEVSERLDARLAATTKTLLEAPTLETLQTLQQEWQSAQLQTMGWLNALTLEATKLQNALNHLSELQETWRATRASAQAANAPAPILSQIDATLAMIGEAQPPLQARRAYVLDLQSRVARQVTKAATALQRVAEVQQKAVAGIFHPDAAPVWTIDLRAAAFDVLPAHIGKVGQAIWKDIIDYVLDPRQGGPLHAAIFILLALVFCAARRKIHTGVASDQAASAAITIFKRPYAAALVTTLLLATSPLFQIPVSVRQLLVVIALVPMIRLVRPMINASLAPAVYALAVLFAVDAIRQALAGVQAAGQVILVAETFAAIVAVLWLRRQRLRMGGDLEGSQKVLAAALSGRLILTILIFSLAAAAAGYTRLARLLTPGILAAGVLGLAAGVHLAVSSGIVVLALRVWPLRLLKMVQHHRELLEKHVYRGLVWIALAGWFIRCLIYLGLLDPIWSLVRRIWDAELNRGAISISTGEIIEFVFTIWLACLLSKFIRFILQEDVYPRIRLAPGLSYATSSLLNYIILSLGFIAALGALGIDFSKVTILAGAFGVGIGFGLQGVVNNFVSGLVLLFERPIHIGDTVEVGNLRGRVRRIGIRASVLHTGDGADIIVPNSQLVTEKVTNWTLNDNLRRIDLPVGINYGANPGKVIGLLVSVAKAHPRVLERPPPRAFFVSYGDNAINFELHAWTDESDERAQIKSDLAAAVYDEVNAAGMAFPFPQREVRVLRDPVANSDGEVAPSAAKSAARSAQDKSA